MTLINQNRLGIGLMCLGILLFALNDVMGKWLVATYTVGQVLLLRSLAAILILVPFILKEGVGTILNAPRPGLQLARVAFGTIETACFYWAVTTLPLVSVMTYYLSAPLYVAAIAPFLLRERLARDQWIAVVLGFIGVLMVLRPSAETLTLPAIVAIIGSLLYAGLMLSTRMLRGTSATSLIVWQTTGALVLGAVLAPFGWVQPTWRDFALLSMLGVVAMGAHVLVAQALRIAPAAVVSPFNYTLIVWAAIFGWLFFGEWPDGWMIAGAIVIVAAGLYLLSREGRTAPTPQVDPP
ncbi:MAG: DMT family transporter [Methylocystis sp.]|nr:DMT family transporter [Methylocystis sp.]MCA3583263.1 DMT family transporter [Methylocystis sp.]MCA3588048.1 DMT family transporter [Methylocystis sp.]MCA3591510.1 DMT family transporter [Methylocystis sp.]